MMRRTLFTIHMWVGLILGVLLAVLGLSGSLLVYDEAIADFLNPAPPAVTQRPMLPLDRIAEAINRSVAGGPPLVSTASVGAHR